MPDRQIANPANAFGLPNTDAPAVQVVAEVVNNSGGTLLPGDVVVMSDVNGLLATTSTSVSDMNVKGVVLPVDRGLRTVGSTETYAAGAVMPVCVLGNARVNIAANTVAAGGNIATSAAAKVGAVPAAAGSVGALQNLIGSFIAVAQESQAAKDANNTIRCHVGKM